MLARSQHMSDDSIFFLNTYSVPAMHLTRLYNHVEKLSQSRSLYRFVNVMAMNNALHITVAENFFLARHLHSIPGRQ